MELINKRGGLLLGLMLVAAVSVVAFFWLNRGYGEVSPQTYQYSKALYTACQTKNEAHLQKVQEMLQNQQKPQLPDRERRWIESIVAQAVEGDWEGAASKARRMMLDQVKY